MIHNLDNKPIVDDQSQLPTHYNNRREMMYKTYFNRGTQLPRFKGPRIKGQPSVTIPKKKIKRHISRTEFHINEISHDQWFATERCQKTQTRDQLSQTNLTLFPQPPPRREKILCKSDSNIVRQGDNRDFFSDDDSEKNFDDESESAALLQNN